MLATSETTFYRVRRATAETGRDNTLTRSTSSSSGGALSAPTEDLKR